MALPPILTAGSFPVELPRPDGSALLSVDDFVMQCQQRRNWCWAAVAASIYLCYHNRAPRVRFLHRLSQLVTRVLDWIRGEQDWTLQCKIVTQCLGEGVNCCEGVGKDDCMVDVTNYCNQGGELRDALNAVKEALQLKTSSAWNPANPLRWLPTVREQIGAKRLVGLTLKNTGTAPGGHAVAVYAVSKANASVWIRNPASPEAEIPLNFGEPYESRDWDRLYWT